MKEVVATNYAANAVACKLWGLVGSPTEMIFGMAIFDKLSNYYKHWTCWVYAESEFWQLAADPNLNGRHGTFVLVPQFAIATVGRVDFAIFIPGLSTTKPIAVIECDGHSFHERTVEQASKDRARDRALARLEVPAMRYTGTDILRKSAEFAHEVGDFVDERSDELERRWYQDNFGIDLEAALQQAGGFYAPYLWPRAKTNLHARLQD
jgi:very-short-patch-repair endonuclease